MFINAKAVSEDEIVNELNLMMGYGGTTFAMPIKNYLAMGLTLGLKDLQDEEKFNDLLITQAIGIGGLLEKNHRGSELGSTLFSSSTWHRYKRQFREQDKQGRVTGRMMKTISDGMALLPLKTFNTFWTEVVNWSTVAVRKGAVGMQYYSMTNRATSKVAYVPFVVIDIEEFYWPFRYILHSSIGFKNNAAKIRKRASRELMGIATFAKTTLGSDVEDTLNQLVGLMVEYTDAVNEFADAGYFPLNNPGALSATELAAVGKVLTDYKPEDLGSGRAALAMLDLGEEEHTMEDEVGHVLEGNKNIMPDDTGKVTFTPDIRKQLMDEDITTSVLDSLACLAQKC